MRGVIVIIAIALALLVPVVSAAIGDYRSIDSVVINSKDWTLVYSGILFAKTIGADAVFVQNESSPNSVLGSIDGKNILLIESDPLTNGLKSLLQANRYTVSDYDYRGNYVMAQDLGIKNFIIINPAYGYDAISVAPLSLITESFVLFSDELPDSIDAENIIFYGQIDDSIKDGLNGKSSTESIDEGGKYLNNIEAVKRFIDMNPTTQAIFTSGDFIEKDLFSRNFPVVFIGDSKVPDEVESFIAGSDFATATLVGVDLASHVSSFKRTLKNKYDKDFGILLMLGQSSVEEGEKSKTRIITPDEFPIPILKPKLEVLKVIYNELTKEFEVTIKNGNELKLYYILSINFGDQSIGDNDIQAIEGNRVRTFTYPYNLTRENVSGKVTVLFGSEETSLDNQIDFDFSPLERLEIEDNSEIGIEWVKYDKKNKAFRVEISNTGSVAAYADLELDAKVSGEQKTFTSASPERIDPGKKSEMIVWGELTNLDLEQNRNVTIRAYYGQREGTLINTLGKTLPLGIYYNYTLYIVIAAAVIVAIIILILILRKRSRKN